MVKNNLILLALSLVFANSCYALSYNDINFPKDPAYRLGTSDSPEKIYVQAEVQPVQKEYVEKDTSIEHTPDDLTYADLSLKRMSSEIASELSREEDLLFICGHYEGMDQRIIDHYVDDEFSIGDYVLTSGESASVVIIDALFRLIDGVISRDSLEDESFQSSLLEYDQYTRPERYCNSSVPSVLLSGNHALICSWRDDNRIAKTMRSRPDMLSEASLSLRMRRKLIKIIEEFGIEDL